MHDHTTHTTGPRRNSNFLLSAAFLPFDKTRSNAARDPLSREHEGGNPFCIMITSAAVTRRPPAS